MVRNCSKSTHDSINDVATCEFYDKTCNSAGDMQDIVDLTPKEGKYLHAYCTCTGMLCHKGLKMDVLNSCMLPGKATV